MKPWEQFKNQKQWREYITRLIKNNDRALHRSILVIYDLQTQEEKVLHSTVDHNGVGFGGIDAEFMSSLALKLKGGKPLTLKEKAIARNKMPKYWKQLMKISKGEIRVETVQEIISTS